MVKNRLSNFIRQSILWILLFFLFCLLLTSCIGIANLITAPNPVSAANSADELLKALQQGDRKTVERLLANPRQTSELLQRWNRYIAMAGALQSWERMRISREPFVIGVYIGDGIEISRYPTHVEYRVKFERSETILKIDMHYVGKKWKIKSFTLVYTFID
jgi:hypothetical protein